MELTEKLSFNRKTGTYCGLSFIISALIAIALFTFNPVIYALGSLFFFVVSREISRCIVDSNHTGIALGAYFGVWLSLPLCLFLWVS